MVLKLFSNCGSEVVFIRSRTVGESGVKGKGFACFKVVSIQAT